MKKLSTIIAAGIVVCGGVAFAHAEDATVSGSASVNVNVPPPMKEVRTGLKDVRAQKMDVKDQIKNIQETVKGQLKDLRVTTKNDLRSATSGPERKEILQGARDDRKDLRDTRKASTTALRANLKDLARQHIGLIGQRFAIALKQFDDLTTRIQSRIDKLKAAGTDTSSVERLLATAKTAIAQAITDARAVSDLVAQITDASDPKTVKTQLDTAVRTANASIKKAHEALQATVRALVQISGPVKVRATTTVEVQN